MIIKENVNLAKFSSFKVGGPAARFAEVHTEDEMAEALASSGEKFFVLGGGTNTLFNDAGYTGTVIKNLMKQIKLHERDIIEAETGVTLVEINAFANSHGLVGFEKMATVPGTLGGALYNNAHWLETLLADFVVSVSALSLENGKVEKVELLPGDLRFSYDHSVFKERQVVALGAKLQLAKGDVGKARADLLGYLRKRAEAHPYGTMNCGCMFQNVDGTSAGYLIDQCGLKGAKIGGAEVSTKHANFFINSGGATSADIAALVKLCQDRVKEKFGFDLKLEVHEVV
jgi:UDP-N-acetylmuramate dehydrogenase